MYFPSSVSLGPQLADTAPHVPPLRSSGLLQSLSVSHSDPGISSCTKPATHPPLPPLLPPPLRQARVYTPPFTPGWLLSPKNDPGIHRRGGGRGGGGSSEIFLSLRQCSSAGQGSLHLPRRGAGIMREEREDGEGACCCCSCCLCLLQYEHLSLA